MVYHDTNWGGNIEYCSLHGNRIAREIVTIESIQGRFQSVPRYTKFFDCRDMVKWFHSSILLRQSYSFTRFLRPIDDFQLLNARKGMIVGDEDRVQRKSVSGNHDIQVSHRLAFAF